jgi:hypothetical protein
MKVITRAKGGTLEREVAVADIQIPDLWHLAHDQKSKADTEKILELWHLAHDLLRAIKGAARSGKGNLK